LKRSKYGQYKEAWGLLRRVAKIDHLEGCAAQEVELPLGETGAEWASETLNRSGLDL
jgi:hypothetical protein